MDKETFVKGETVWHTNFKCKVKYISELRPIKGRWFYVELPNGGFMETQLITKYKNQDEKTTM